MRSFKNSRQESYLSEGNEAARSPSLTQRGEALFQLWLQLKEAKEVGDTL